MGDSPEERRLGGLRDQVGGLNGEGEERGREEWEEEFKWKWGDAGWWAGGFVPLLVSQGRRLGVGSVGWHQPARARPLNHSVEELSLTAAHRHQQPLSIHLSK